MKKRKYFGLSLTLTVAMAGLSRPLQAQDPALVSHANLSAHQHVDLRTLATHLDAEDWAAADQETRQILQRFVHPRGDIFAEPMATQIPSAVLQAIDQLWVEASDGRFGFSPQLTLWQALNTQTLTDPQSAAERFGDRVGWTRQVPSEDYIFISPNWLTEPELTYSLAAPVGHLPWAGIDWSIIEGLLTAQSCGSCTIDALYLQDDRFDRYLPFLYHWAQTALTEPIPPAGAGEQP